MAGCLAERLAVCVNRRLRSAPTDLWCSTAVSIRCCCCRRALHFRTFSCVHSCDFNCLCTQTFSIRFSRWCRNCFVASSSFNTFRMGNRNSPATCVRPTVHFILSQLTIYSRSLCSPLEKTFGRRLRPLFLRRIFAEKQKVKDFAESSCLSGTPRNILSFCE